MKFPRFSFPVRLASLAWLSIAAGLVPAVSAQDSVSLASKAIGQVHAVQNRVFAFAEGGASYSQLDLFDTVLVKTRAWPWNGGAEGGASWQSSLLLRANYFISDSQRVARVTSLRYAGTFRGGDSLIFRDPLDTSIALLNGTRLTALAVRDSAGTATAALGFGRLGFALAGLAAETNPNSIFSPADSQVRFLALPTGSDTALSLPACRWNSLCRADTLTGLPPLDSVIALAVDSSAPDSAWLLIATQRGLRRGVWGGEVFPYVALDSTLSAVRSVFTAPSHGLAWVFTGSRFFFSEDHGASFRVPPDVPGLFSPSDLTGYDPARPPHAAFYGDTTLINFNLDRPGLVLFHRDTILSNAGMGLGAVLLDTADGLDLSQSEGSLTALAVAGLSGQAAAVIVVGSTIKGIFHRRLDAPGTSFRNENRLKSLRGGLAEVITYPTLLTAGTCRDGSDPARVRLGYRLKKDARVTITVYNYAMEKVKVIVKNARRSGGGARSESVSDDHWDGCDQSGRFVSLGTYYVLVESDQGEKAFGKVIVTRGRR